MFLSDRFIKGSCPKCGAEDQHGDNCSVCGASYDVLEIKDPISIVSGTTPVKKKSEHVFFDLPKTIDILNRFLDKANLQTPIKNKLKEIDLESMTPIEAIKYLDDLKKEHNL